MPCSWRKSPLPPRPDLLGQVFNRHHFTRLQGQLRPMPQPAFNAHVNQAQQAAPYDSDGGVIGVDAEGNADVRNGRAMCEPVTGVMCSFSIKIEGE
jgi:hypothetical protein